MSEAGLDAASAPGSGSGPSGDVDEEPRLKYSRLGNDVQRLLERDAASCVRVHPRFLCVGTRWGSVHVLDHEGNTVLLPRQLRPHAVAVNALALDARGDRVASCADDGRVLVRALCDDGEEPLELRRPGAVLTVALEAGPGARLLTGDAALTLHERALFGRLRSTELWRGEGAVQAVAWRDRFAAWACEAGVRVFDLVARRSLGLIQWELPAARGCRCNLLWSTADTLMIGWADTVRICVVRRRSRAELRARDDTEYLVDPTHTFRTDCYISGLGPLDNQLVVLGVPKDCDPETGKTQRPTLTVADYKDCEYSEFSSDTLNIRDYEQYSCNDYHLDVLIEENRYFIVSPKEILVASLYDIDDRVDWLTRHGKYEKAMIVLKEVGRKTGKQTVITVGVQYIDHLLSENKYEDAAALCFRICTYDNKTLWESQIMKFAEINQLRVLTPYIPKTPDCALSPHIYELVFYEFLKMDPPGFLQLVTEWNPVVYKPMVIIKAVIDHLLSTEDHKNIYLEALALLYWHSKRYDKALTTYLKLQHKDVYTLVIKHGMYSYIQDKLLELMELDCEQTVSMLMEKNCCISAEMVVPQLEAHDMFLYKYLEAYSKLEPNGRYHEKLVKLYALYSRDKLLPFLKHSNNYPIQDALDICQAHNFYPEMVFLLGRIGNTREALQIIIEQLGDIGQAINFCQEHNDRELWTDLIKQTVDKPQYVTLLLKRIGNCMDPRMLIENIKPGCQITDLKDSLAKMMGDYHLQLSVQEACKAITLRNYFDLHERLVRGQQHGVAVTDDFVCSVCDGRIIVRDLANASDLVVYNCRHSFHIGCLPSADQNLKCAVCNAIQIK